MPLIEISGDVWLLADIIGIKLNEPEDEDDDWEIELMMREWAEEDAQTYYFPEAKAKKKHLELIEAWKKWLTS